MYIDKEATLGTAQAVTASAGTSDYYDAGAARDIGVSEQLYMVFTILTQVTAASTLTVNFQVQCDDNSSFTSPKIPVQSDAIPKATLAPNYQVILPIPPGLDERYIRGYFSNTENWTAGTVTTQIISGLQKNKAYPDGI